MSSSFPGSDPFGGKMDDVLGGLFSGTRPKPKKPEKGVPWEAKVIDGQYYIPLRQVADLLEQNDVLPAVQAGIRRRVAEGPNPPKTKEM